jgi:hypothetical protein
LLIQISMASEGAVTYPDLLDMPVQEVLLIAGAIGEVLDKRNP